MPPITIIYRNIGLLSTSHFTVLCFLLFNCSLQGFVGNFPPPKPVSFLTIPPIFGIFPSFFPFLSSLLPAHCSLLIVRLAPTPSLCYNNPNVHKFRLDRQRADFEPSPIAGTARKTHAQIPDGSTVLSLSLSLIIEETFTVLPIFALVYQRPKRGLK